MASRGDADSDVDSESDDLYEEAPCALLSTHQDGTIVRANRTFFDWLGASSDAILGKARFQSLLTIGSRIYYETHYAPLLQMQGFVNEIALDLRSADGMTRPVVASARRRSESAGTLRLNRIALFDSADRRSYEQELLASRRRAEAVAGELAVADQQKAEFMAVLAHELRNPLAPARMALEVLRRQSADGQSVEKMAAIIDRQLRQMTRLVEDLFDIGRIDQHKLSIQPVTLDLASVVHHALEMSTPLFEACGVTCAAELSDAPIYVEGDAARLVQVIGNLLNNAAKFTPRGGAVKVLIERSGQDALVRVRDTGMGISADQLPRIFEMFMQAHAPLEGKSGLGIGLALAKNLIEQHRGRITVSSEGLGRGAEFAVHLPALCESPASISKVAPSPTRGPLTARRILVVDDNRDSVEVTTLLLSQAGHDVRAAANGLVSLEVAESFQPEVVLLDIGLPGLNGYEVAKQIRAYAKAQPVLVAVTGWGQADDRKRSQLAGFDAHLVKPVDHDELIELIAQLRAN